VIFKSKPGACGSPATHIKQPLRIITWLAFLALPAQQPVAEDLASFTTGLDPATMDLCEAAEDGFLSGDLYGALSEHIEWQGTDMDCGGMLRPDDGGIRLVFAAPRQEERLLIVLGIDGTLDTLSDGEHVANLTIIDETRNRFYSTSRRERCWSTITSVRPVTDHPDRILQVVGEVYCAGSLPSLSDNSSVTLRDMRYSGRLLLDEPDQN
jgi:hypothetical protein